MIWLPSGVYSVPAALAEPCEPSTAPVVTRSASPVPENCVRPPIHRPPRTMCSKPVPSGYSNDGDRETKLLPKKP